MKPTKTAASPAQTRNGTRHRIVQATRAHFFSHGFRSVTMDDLARELAISKKTLYAHFPSKTALLEAVLDDKFAGLESRLKQLSGEHPHNFSSVLNQLLALALHELDEIKPPFVRDMRQKAPHVFDTVQRRRGQLIEKYFGKLFVEGQRAGMVRKDVPANLIIELLLNAVQAIVNPAKVQELGLTPKTAFASVLNVVLEGVLTSKGRKI